ncbi:MAG: DNA-binding protein WhiA [Clostridia bacterium]|nr:DNA-binding protein WhiA [Clostridia bacterium]
MNFTSDVKKEIITRNRRKKSAKNTAGLSAFLRTSGAIGMRDGAYTFFIVSETENVAEFFTSAFSEIFHTELAVTHATMDRMSGRDKLLLQCPAAQSEQVLQALGLLKNGEPTSGIDSALLRSDEQKIGYIQGAFLGGGSCTIPTESGKTGYHLEIVFSDKKTAKDFCALLDEFSLFAKLTQRKDTHVAYIKNKEGISDFLSVIGAHNSLRKFSELVEKRDEANNSNRAQNCMAGNADKTAIAAVKQVVAIEKLQVSGVLETLAPELQALAKTRLEKPAMTLKELAEYFKISKSCLNHRLRRLIELSQQTEKPKTK